MGQSGRGVWFFERLVSSRLASLNALLPLRFESLHSLQRPVVLYRTA